MRIDVFSDTRVPTIPRGGHGLGRLAIDLARGLQARGHHVWLHAGPGSATRADLGIDAVIEDGDERTRAERCAFGADAVLDLSHRHDLSRINPDAAVVNWIVDTEVGYPPPNAVVGNAWQQRAFPSARIVPLGIDVDAVPFRAEPDGEHFVFCHKLEWRKGPDFAVQVGERAGVQVRFAGERFGQTPEHYVGELAGDAELHAFLGGARALLSPAREDAGGRVNLESAACGTPVLTFDWTGTACHVEHCVSGFVCRDMDEMVEAARDVRHLDRAGARAWVNETHDLGRMLDGIEKALEAVEGGERW